MRHQMGKRIGKLLMVLGKQVLMLLQMKSHLHRVALNEAQLMHEGLFVADMLPEGCFNRGDALLQFIETALFVNACWAFLPRCQVGTDGVENFGECRDFEVTTYCWISYWRICRVTTISYSKCDLSDR